MAANQQQKQSQQKQKQGNQADAATQEVAEDTGRTIEVQGQTLTIPDNQPSQILFSARQVSRATRTGDEGAAVEAMMDMAVAYVGEDELHEILDPLDLEDGMSVVEDILAAASESYGADTGE